MGAARDQQQQREQQHAHPHPPHLSPTKRRPCRPAGAPAGTAPHEPWWHCVFHDPYERINFWSHALPGAALLVAGLCAHHGALPGGAALSVFCCCAALTHLLSALTHVYPDDSALEKLDHLGIVALIVGTPLTQLMALDPAADRRLLLASCAGLGVAAFLPPLARTVAFVGLGALQLVVCAHVVNTALVLQGLLYLGGAVCFIRSGGHDRFVGLTDHHLLHYLVSIACALQVANILAHAQAMPSAEM